MPKFNAAIAGIYESPRRKAPEIHPFQILQEVITGALEDAGLKLSDVDGLGCAAGDFCEGGAVENVTEVAEYLGIQPTYFDSTDVGGCSPIVQLGHAAAAITAGLAETVVVAYAACPRWYPIVPDTPMSLPVGPGAYEMPFGITNIAAYAIYAARHSHVYGTTREQLATIPVVMRQNAATNPDALYRDPITIDDVASAAPISSPFTKLDCCVVTDSGGAVVLTRSEKAKDLLKPPVDILGYGETVRAIHLNQVTDLTVSPGSTSGKRAFEMAGVTPQDIDVAQFYDAFSITPLISLEDLGFCKKGEGGPFVASGAIHADGSIPINTDGGGLSSNHPGKRGVFALIEGVRQLRGEGPGVQVPDVELSLVHGIGGFFSAASTVIMARV